MKFSKSLFLAAALTLLTTAGFANPNSATPVSGNYEGNLETKTFLPSRDGVRASTALTTNIRFMFNGNVFIYQDKHAKAMGTYELEGDLIRFTVTSVKGDEAFVDKIFGKQYKYSRSGGTLMLVGQSAANSDILVYTLNKE